MRNLYLAATCLTALSAPALPLVAQAPFRVDTGVAVPMRNGVVVRADLYRPPGDRRFQVPVYRTPSRASRGATTG